MSEPSLGSPQFASLSGLEAVGIVGIMITACYVNRLRDFSIIPPKQGDQGLLGHTKRYDDLLFDGSSDQEDSIDITAAPTTTHSPKKKRKCGGMVFYTPNTSHNANYWHSRFIQKFPFLVEMFYWVINLFFYGCIKTLRDLIFTTDGVWQAAQDHGVNILWFEHESSFRFLFPLREVDVQMFFMNEHQDLLTILNQAYSLIHIPVTVSFLAWYYYAAPTRSHFAAARRMMNLTNLISFVIFTIFPCMPPRLLPDDFGFFDTVRREDAESIYASNKFFNQLAAFPSLHFGYSFGIGTVLLYHSGILRHRLASPEKRMSKPWQFFFAGLSVVYPAFVLTIIVSTANHYWLDALAATLVVAVAWQFNRILIFLLPIEDWFLWCTKLKKPIPTVGNRS